jgi:hypothetical protein
MIYPIFYATLNQEPNVNFTVDGNTLLWSLICGVFFILGFFIVRYINKNEDAFKELEMKVDKGFEKFDERMDKLDRNQIRIMVKLGIDEE